MVCLAVMAGDIMEEEAEEDSPAEVVVGAAAEVDSPEAAHRGVGDERNTHSR
jgi:hypothetical protein